MSSTVENITTKKEYGYSQGRETPFRAPFYFLIYNTRESSNRSVAFTHLVQWQIRFLYYLLVVFFSWKVAKLSNLCKLMHQLRSSLRYLVWVEANIDLCDRSTAVVIGIIGLQLWAFSDSQILSPLRSGQDLTDKNRATPWKFLTNEVNFDAQWQRWYLVASAFSGLPIRISVKRRWLLRNSFLNKQNPPGVLDSQ